MINDRFGSVDLLVNNAGVMQWGPVEHMRAADFAEAFSVHVSAMLETTEAVIPLMRERGSGRIVNIASFGGLVAVPHAIPYCASKFAAVGLSNGYRAELAKDGISVTTVCPWVMRTGSHVNALFRGQHAKEFASFALLASVPLLSVSVERAARKVVEAARVGKPQVIIGWQAKLLNVVDAVAPNLTARLLALAARVMPKPIGPVGDQTLAGWQSRSRLTPGWLTAAADNATKKYNGALDHPI